MTTATSTTSTVGGGPGIRLVRRVIVINLGLVGFQALSAGFLMSGYARALTVHEFVAVGLELGVLIQAIVAVVLWRRRRVPSWVAGVSIGLLMIVFLQVGFGYRKLYWLHVPVGVGIFGGLTRQANRLDTLRRATEARS